MRDALDVLQGFARGFVHDLLIGGKTARELDALEFRDWLVSTAPSPRWHAVR